jgi:hypothetical protein
MAPDKEKPPAAVSAARGFDDLAENFQVGIAPGSVLLRPYDLDRGNASAV